MGAVLSFLKRSWDGSRAARTAQEEQEASGPPNSASPDDPGDDTQNGKVVEEGKNAYKPGGFHPVYIGDVYHDRYKILNKIGYGRYSTVWLARDLQAAKGDSHEFVAVKVLSALCYGQGHDIFELEILKHLRAQDKNELGYTQVCHLLHDFEHKGPNGTHVCLVFELMGESLASFGAWFPNSMIPYPVMRRFTIQLLLVLNFCHDHNVIHTDIQPNNIFVKMRNYTRIESEYLTKEPIPQQDKKEQQYTVIPSRPLYNYYIKDGDRFDEFDIALGDWGVASWADNHLSELIQPVALRAPEVLLGATWDIATDFWNLGAVILEVFRAVRMFDGRDSSGKYSLELHLAEIEHLIGPFPKALLDKADPTVIHGIFDDEGRVKNVKLSSNRPTLNTEEYLTGLDQEGKDEFVSFLLSMMKIDPAERPIAEDLLRGPWLRAIA